MPKEAWHWKKIDDSFFEDFQKKNLSSFLWHQEKLRGLILRKDILKKEKTKGKKHEMEGKEEKMLQNKAIEFLLVPREGQRDFSLQMMSSYLLKKVLPSNVESCES